MAAILDKTGIVIKTNAIIKLFRGNEDLGTGKVVSGGKKGLKLSIKDKPELSQSLKSLKANGYSFLVFDYKPNNSEATEGNKSYNLAPKVTKPNDPPKPNNNINEVLERIIGKYLNSLDSNLADFQTVVANMINSINETIKAREVAQEDDVENFNEIDLWLVHKLISRGFVGEVYKKVNGDNKFYFKLNQQ